MAAKRRKPGGTRRAALRKKKRRTTLKIIKYLFFLALIFGVIMYTPIFKLKAVFVEGNSIVSNEDILNAAALEHGKNVLRLPRKETVGRVEKIPYVSNAKIKYIFPDKLKIVVAEGSLYYGFKDDVGYINTDENIKVIEHTDAPKVYPVITGLKFSKSDIGEKLTIDENEKFDIILVYYNLLKEKEMLGDVEYINIDGYNVSFKLKSGVSVICGTRQDAVRKIAAFKASLEQTLKTQEHVTMGKFDVTNPKQVVYSLD